MASRDDITYFGAGMYHLKVSKLYSMSRNTDSEKGPALLPTDVLNTAAAALVNYQETVRMP